MDVAKHLLLTFKPNSFLQLEVPGSFPSGEGSHFYSSQDIERFYFLFKSRDAISALGIERMEEILMCSTEGTTVSNAASQSEISSAEQQFVVSALEYEVFLSFRGPDVRNSFADFLYNYLVRSKIRTFRDEEELRKGETIAPSLIQAIAESEIYIPILSKTYASSKWCLQELAKMVECCRKGNRRIILPVFYFMDPGDVRHQAGPYEEAFQQHSKIHDPIIVQEWRKALKEVGQMKGWHVTEIDGQGAAINEIFSKVELHLRSNYTLVTEELVGIDSHVQEVVRLLDLDGNGKIVGIQGIGGMGKTTIAKAVYDNICTNFNRCCFLENIRELMSKSDGITSLQNKLISSILRDNVQVKDASEGINIIRERVCKYKVLVVLDDVDDMFEFGQILGKSGNFSSGSRFIITTRDKRVLELLPEYKFYEPKEMSHDHCLQLFSRHAFGMHYPPEDHAALCDEFVKVSANLPLALKVLGSLMFRRERQFWEEKLMQLKEVPGSIDKVQQRLKISYDELTCYEKQIFLDIACFFIGEDKESAIHMWSDCKFYPESGISTLVLRSLIKIDGTNRLWMHDHLKDLGRAIVIEEDVNHPYNRSRIWTNEDAIHMLKNKKGTDRVEMLRVDVENSNFAYLTKKCFQGLSRLRYLDMKFPDLPYEHFCSLRSRMRFLRLSRGFLIPYDLNLKNVEILELRGWANCRITGLGSILAFRQGWYRLKTPALLKRTPNILVQAAHKLKVLNLHGCYHLRRVPDLSQCGSLESIDISQCRNMMGKLNISALSNLKVVMLRETGIALTGDMRKLNKLEEIRTGSLAWGSIKVPALPTSLKRITISSPRIPNLLELKDLEELCFENCDKAPEISGDIWQLTKLKTLKAVKCSCEGSLLSNQDGSLPSSLTCLIIDWSGGLTRLPNLGNLSNLIELRLIQFRASQIHGLGKLRVLEALEVSGSVSLDHLHGLQNLVNLKELILKSCGLKGLPNLSNMIKLHKLVIVECPLLSEIQGLGELKRSLLHLEVSYCDRLAHMDGLESLEALDSTTLSPDISNPLAMLTLKEDEVLNSHEPFPDLSRLQNLQQLCITGWRQLQEVLGLERLKSLSSLEMKACKSLRRLPNLVGLDNLETLNVSGCIQVVDATGLDRLESLQKLNMSNCWAIEELPDISGMKSLNVLNVSECIKLVRVTGLEKLESLEELYMVDCKSIKELPDMSGLENLMKLNLKGCTNLKNVKGLEKLSLLWTSKFSNLKLRSIEKDLDKNSIEAAMAGTHQPSWEELVALRKKIAAAYFHRLEIPRKIKPARDDMEQKLVHFGEGTTAPNTASQSQTSSAAQQPVEHEVFLSFRGPDVRNDFADFLYSYLVRSKIRTFRDEEELPKGETIAPSLIQAIEESKIYIPILSESYASSKWCLLELAKMIECCRKGKGHVMLPIFYLMGPGDVRQQSGPYKVAFEQHSEKHDPETGAVVADVFSKVEFHLRTNYTLVTEELVGIESHVQEVMRLLNLDSRDGKIVGIRGIGGMGKTTLAKAVYDNISQNFNRCCFLENTRELLLKNNGIVSLQNRLISSILRDDVQVKDASEGIKMITERVCKYKVLVVLDDVDDKFEFDQILGKLGDFSSESKFIITTRNKRVLDILPECKLYEPKEMSHTHSVQLFSKHAFRLDSPPEGYATLCDGFVKVAARLPLALKVIGSLLFRREKKFWDEKLKELNDLPASSNEVQQRLKISYNELTPTERHIFLDIACFFIGKDKESPIHMWSDCKLYPESGVTTLVLRSLIKIDERNQFWMHDLLRDLGRAIVIEEDVKLPPCKRSRIWSNEDAWNMLKNAEGTDQVEMLKIDSGDGSDRKLTAKSFEKLTGLMYLDISCATLTGDFSGILPNIRWLRLHQCRSVPTDLNLQKVAILDLESSSVEDDWRGWSQIQVADKLKVINLRSCYELKKVPDLAKCKSLESIDFTDCFRMTGELHIGSFRNLKVIRFPMTEITDLTGEIGQLQDLQELIMGKLVWRAQEIVLPTSLKRLTISSPAVSNLLELKELEELCFMECDTAPEIPGEIWQLTKLKTLKLYKCNCNDSLLLDNDGALPSSLTSLIFDGCSYLSRLPNLGNLNSLTELRLINVGVTEIHGLGELRMLEGLKISKFAALNNLKGLENLVNLKELALDNCIRLEDLPNLSNLIKLESLVIIKCPRLSTIQGLRELRRSLLNLEVSGCGSLEKIEAIESMEALESLTLESEKSLPSHVLSDMCLMTTFEDEEFTQYLRASPVEQFPDLSPLQKLRNLYVLGWSKLPEVTGIERLTWLKCLEMTACKTLRRLPDLSGLKNLEYLNVTDCILLVDVTSVVRLESLRILKFPNCTSLEELPDISGLKNLESLDVKECTKLVKVTGLEKLEKLKELLMRDCKSIKELPDMSGLKNLHILDLQGCTELKTVKGLERLEGLWNVYMEDWLLAKHALKLTVWAAWKFGRSVASGTMRSRR
ncbi:Disease resistance protein L6 [Linum grandiflorum]